MMAAYPHFGVYICLLLLVAVCADGAVRVFRIDDASSKSFK
jgi:hypothetical protein